MPLGLIAFIAWLAFMTLTTGAFILWAWRDGQFKNMDEINYRMLIDREPEPWPGREKPKPLTPGRPADE